MLESLPRDLVDDEALLERAILAYFKSEDAGQTLDPQAWMTDYPPTIRPALQAFLAKHLATRRIWQAGLWVSPGEESGIWQTRPQTDHRGDSTLSIDDAALKHSQSPIVARARWFVAAGLVVLIVMAGLWAVGAFK